MTDAETMARVAAGEPRPNFEEIGRRIGALVAEKNACYGDSFARSDEILRILYPNGIQPEQYTDALGMIRLIDKMFRIATRKDAFGESPWTDATGYGILGVANDERRAAECGAAATEAVGTKMPSQAERHLRFFAAETLSVSSRAWLRDAVMGARGLLRADVEPAALAGALARLAALDPAVCSLEDVHAAQGVAQRAILGVANDMKATR